MHFGLASTRINYAALISMWIPKGEAFIRRQRLFEVQFLLEEMQDIIYQHSEINHLLGPCFQK